MYLLIGNNARIDREKKIDRKEGRGKKENLIVVAARTTRMEKKGEEEKGERAYKK